MFNILEVQEGTRGDWGHTGAHWGRNWTETEGRLEVTGVHWGCLNYTFFKCVLLSNNL